MKKENNKNIFPLYHYRGFGFTVEWFFLGQYFRNIQLVIIK